MQQPITLQVHLISKSAFTLALFKKQLEFQNIYKHLTCSCAKVKESVKRHHALFKIQHWRPRVGENCSSLPFELYVHAS